jgi:hypothetical protein
MESHRKGFLKLKCFSPLKILTSPLFGETLGAFLSLPLSLSLCSISWGLGGFDDIWGGNHFFKNFLSNGFNILEVDAYSEMELCTATWLNHDYGDGGVVDILAVDAYSGVELRMPLFFWARLANNVGSKSCLNFFKTQIDTSPNKSQHNKSRYVDNIWLW